MSAAGRRWLELRARGPGGEDGAALLSEGLLALGGRATEEREGWVVSHVAEPADLDAFRARALLTLEETSGVRGIELVMRIQDHEDWAEAWKRGLDTRRISDRLLVTPSWIPVRPEPGQVVLVIDPGVAFGTAEHGTTRGCLRLLDRVVRAGDRILDVGAGSGILGIAAALLGAADVVAIEGDPLACEVLGDNVTANRVEGAVRCVPSWADADLLAELGPRRGVLANIETRPLRALLPGFHAALEPEGWLILSGVPDREWPAMVETAADERFVLRETDADGEWRSGRFERLAEADQAD